jgi:hypothetical protein
MSVELQHQVKACAPSWWAAQWSECSSKCEDVEGVQTRLVFCGTLAEDGTIANTTEDSCQVVKFSFSCSINFLNSFVEFNENS